MSIFGIFGVLGLSIASAVLIAFLVLFILGLRRAAAPDVVEDTGDYE